MADQAASILNQIKSLVHQYLALPGATPLDAAFNDLLPQLNQGAQAMPGGGAESPVEQQGDVGPETPAEDTGEGGRPPNFKDARAAALPALRRMMEPQGDQGSKAPPGTDQKKGKKKDKAKA